MKSNKKHKLGEYLLKCFLCGWLFGWSLVNIYKEWSSGLWLLYVVPCVCAVYFWIDSHV